MSPTNPNPAAVPQDPYLDATRFPLTTQVGLSLQDQKMLDAVNEDGLREMIEEGDPRVNDAQHKAIAAEFAEKAKLRASARVAAQAAPSPPAPPPPA